GRAFCAAKLAKPGIESSFGFNDLVEDADGFLIARAVRSGKTIVQALTHHYNGGGGLHRFRDFFQGRWGSAETCRYAAHDALTGTDATLGLGRKQLIMLKGVMLPAVLQNTPGGYDKLSEFEQGFVDTLLARVGMERQAAARYEANHRAYLREAAGRARGR
ncbi:MAG TPA: hypothetical protein VFY17_03380, partial [Pilimelia sp.]|nr:hypothetical protein [Pilimelia sp.]